MNDEQNRAELDSLRASVHVLDEAKRKLDAETGRLLAELQQLRSKLRPENQR